MNRRSCQAVMPLAPGTLSAIIRTSPLGEREIIGANDRSADSAYRRDFSARDVDGTDLAAEGLRNVEAAVGSDAHPVGAELRRKAAQTFCYLCISGPPNAKRTRASPAPRQRLDPIWSRRCRV